MAHILRASISLTKMSETDVVCQECYIILEKESNNFPSGPVAIRSFGHQQVCLSCGKSVLRAETHIVPLNCPEWNFIISNKSPQQVHRLKKVCLSCWSNAYRSVRRNTQYDHELYYELYIMKI